MKKSLLFIGVALAAAFVSGCTNSARFDYSAAMGPMPVFAPLPEMADVGVLPAVDLRGEKYLTSNDDSLPAPTGGSFWLGMIPFMPFAWHTLLYPEQGTDFTTLHQFDFLPSADLANAAAESLERSKLFTRVKRVNNLDPVNCKYLWKTEILDTQYRGWLITYGLTYIGAPVLWAIGFPDGISTVDLAVRFSLIDTATGKAVWKYEYVGDDHLWHWIYARIGEDCRLYAELMKFAMAKATTDLNAKLGSR